MRKKLSTEEKLSVVKSALGDRKAEDIEELDLRGRTIIADYFVVASGTSNVHIRSIADGVIEKMKKRGIRPDRIEGYQEAKWVLVDYGDVIVHVFAMEERSFYDIESLWRATAQSLRSE
jgi:ribosome-associated protein